MKTAFMLSGKVFCAGIGLAPPAEDAPTGFGCFVHVDDCHDENDFSYSAQKQ
jgi:hypothetical protein